MAPFSPTNVCLEVCIASLDDAFSAFEAGADRLEVNAALEVGGLTPSLALLSQVRSVVSLPLIAMVRSRAGGFRYGERDFAVMLEDARRLREAGADGIAFGFLHENGEVDRDRTGRMVEVIGEGESVFHRAFDVTPDPQAALEVLIELGIGRVMTSGQCNQAEQGLPLIAQLIEQAAGRIEVLPASGIKPHNVRRIIEATGCRQVHASLRGAVTDPSLSGRPEVRFTALPGDPAQVGVTDAEQVRAMRKMLDGLG